MTGVAGKIALEVVAGDSKFAGGVTIDQAITQTTGGQVTFAGNVDANNGLNVSGAALTVSTNTGSTGTSSGALTVTGGAGIGENLNVGGAVTMRKKIEQVTGSGTEFSVPASDSGIIYFVSGEQRFNLPAKANGLYYKFVVKNNDSDDVKIYGSSANDNNLVYGIVSVAGNTIATAGNSPVDYVSFGTGNNSNQGDYVECFCDGSQWYCTGMAKNSNSLTFEES
eukprot:g611.t1